jgi:hypothetical protein
VADSAKPAMTAIKRAKEIVAKKPLPLVTD